MQVGKCRLGFGTSLATGEAAMDAGLTSLDLMAGPGYTDSVSQVEMAGAGIHGALSLCGVASIYSNAFRYDTLEKGDVVVALAEGLKAFGYYSQMSGSAWMGTAAIGAGTLATLAMGLYSDNS